MNDTTAADARAALIASAATKSGLDPLTRALTLGGIPHKVEDAGGMCLVVTVTTPRVTLVASPSEHETGWQIARFDTPTWETGTLTHPEAGDFIDGLDLRAVVVALTNGTRPRFHVYPLDALVLLPMTCSWCAEPATRNLATTWDLACDDHFEQWFTGDDLSGTGVMDD